MSAEAIVDVKNVGKIYDGGVEALADVNLALPHGGLSTLSGPQRVRQNDASKNHRRADSAQSRRGLGERQKGRRAGARARLCVSKISRCCPGRNVLRNVGFGLELRGMPKEERDRIARKHIAEVGLKAFESSYPHQLSGGMRQRVGLARAFAVDAEIILMDEPFSSVDEQTRRKFQEELLDLLKNKKKTVIFVTHSIEEAAYLSDQIVLLSPRPGTVSKIIQPNIDRQGRSPDEIRRDKNYLDAVDEIWQILKHYI